MGFVISQLSTMQTKESTSNAEYQLTLIMNELTALARQGQAVVEEQHLAGQAYMQNHLDEEGVVDITAVEYVNSAAFTSKYDAQLRAIQAKEQQLNVEKIQIENRQKQNSNLNESWKKSVEKNIQSTFAYFK